ncbi:phytoene/squalene synthase family protein [Nakamurella sp.]|uniref:phytoene/squalene synthase family protein n=1 Tax=Nakamurella sp. TaxID=1869182 RepID=UPI003B3B20AE
MTLAVDEGVLEAGYARCAEITRRNGTTYYWGTQLLPKRRRRHVHAVYALCRLADDIVDDQAVTTGRTPAEIGARLDAFAADFRAAVDSGTTDPVLAAAAHTVRTVGIPQECFDRFFGAMAMDLTTTRYETWDDLLGYMEGSAAVIGEMMLPVLQPRGPEAVAPARALGFAFQYTNFLRDVAEDLDRGRVYLPQDELRRFGVRPVDLGSRRVTPQWRAFMAHEIERARGLYREADRGLAWLPGRSARCVATARVLYSQILDRIEAADYDVFSVRARVPTWRKAGTAARILITGP